jgi:hypothetical protein
MTEQTGVIAKRLRLAFLGMPVGSVAWFAAARGIASLLFGTDPRDPATFAGMILLLIITPWLLSLDIFQRPERHRSTPSRLFVAIKR